MTTLLVLVLSPLMACDRGQSSTSGSSSGSSGGGDAPAAASQKSSGSGFGFFGSDQDCSDTSGADVDPEGGCFSGTLTCGSTLTGHTRNGGSRWEGPFYQRKFCSAVVDPYKGEERAYRFQMERQQRAIIKLTSDCEDLDLFVLQWTGDTCPGMSHSISNCDSDITSKGGSIELEAITHPRNFLIVVEGKGGVDAPFELSAECHSRNH